MEPGGAVEFRMLGALELRTRGRLCELGSAKERQILAVLIAAAGKPVSIETLIDQTWDEKPPPKARESVHSYIARLRARLHRQLGAAPARVVSRAGAYALEVDPECVDVHRFRRLWDQAAAIADSGDEDEALRLLREAEELWRGEPLSGMSGRWARETRTDLENRYRMVVGRRIALELDAGRHADVVGELHGLVAQYPEDESFIAQLMIALYRCGRPGEATEVYHRIQHRIADRFGTDPSPALRRTHEAILHNDPALAAPPARRRGPLATNLPRDTPDFVGRQSELDRLYALLTTTPTAVAIGAIDGMAGVGKTALAIHAAHRLADRFPDGRLHLRLRAHDRTRPPLDPAEGLETLLRMIGEDPGRIPAATEERAALWRARLADRRALVVLDDAASADQVRPFLPGAPGCLVLITSRRRLTGLGGVRSLSLDVLTPREAALLFRHVVGDDRPLDAHGVDEVVRLCDHLPLAITIMANRLRHRPARGVGDLAAKLSRTKDRLAEMHAGDSDVIAAFELSYRELPPDRRRAFRRLGLHIGADFTVDAAAALIGCSTGEAEEALEELIDHHLIEEPESGRARFHDLLRDYARRRMTADEPPDEPRRTVHRLLDFYVHTAERAGRVLYPHRRQAGRSPSDPAAPTAPVEDPREAATWLRAERANLLACVDHAAEYGYPDHAVRLSQALATDLERSARWQDAARMHETVRDICRRSGDPRGEASADLELSLVRSRTGHYHDAFEHARKALSTFRSLDDRLGEAATCDSLARACWLSGRNRAALGYANQALALFRTAGDRGGEGNALLHRGIALWHLGRVDEAVPDFEKALDIARSVGDRPNEAMILNNLGDVHLSRGYHRDAKAKYIEVLSIMREVGWRQNEAVALNNIANAERYKQHYDEALHFYREALSIYVETGDRRNEADALVNIGITYVELERYAEALIHFEKGLARGREIGDPYIEGRALHGIGEAQRGRGRHELARDNYQQALAAARDTTDRELEARCLEGLGDVALHTRGPKSAEILWRQALAIFDRLGASEAYALRARLQAGDVPDQW